MYSLNILIHADTLLKYVYIYYRYIQQRHVHNYVSLELVSNAYSSEYSWDTDKAHQKRWICSPVFLVEDRFEWVYLNFLLSSLPKSVSQETCWPWVLAARSANASSGSSGTFLQQQRTWVEESQPFPKDLRNTSTCVQSALGLELQVLLKSCFS